MADVIPVTSCKHTISPGWNQCFDSILEPSSGQHQFSWSLSVSVIIIDDVPVALVSVELYS